MPWKPRGRAGAAKQDSHRGAQSPERYLPTQSGVTVPHRSGTLGSCGLCFVRFRGKFLFLFFWEVRNNNELTRNTPSRQFAVCLQRWRQDFRVIIIQHQQRKNKNVSALGAFICVYWAQRHCPDSHHYHLLFVCHPVFCMVRLTMFCIINRYCKHINIRMHEKIKV